MRAIAARVAATISGVLASSIRWFIASDGASDADVVTIQLAGAIAEVYLAEPYEKAAEIIESSKTLDEARAALAARKKPFDALLTGQNPNGKR